VIRWKGKMHTEFFLEWLLIADSLETDKENEGQY
jgi:hypothetical protein